MGASENIQSLGIELPPAPTPVGAYVPYVLSRGFLFISGQIPMREGALICQGKVGATVSLDEAQACARQCFLNALSQVKAALGSLDRVGRIVRMTGYVASSDDFSDQALVMNGASELAVQIFGELGKHARVAVGAATLPLGSPVEIEVIVEVKDVNS